jgi:hypothetical protein
LAGVIYGGVLILFMYLLPGGVMGLVRKLSSTKKGRSERPERLVVSEGKTEGVSR